MQVCLGCGALRFPPRVMCPECQSTERGWQALSGSGTIWSFVVVHPPVLPAYAPYAPFPVVTVTLAEKQSLRMVGNLVTAAGGRHQQRRPLDDRDRPAGPGGVHAPARPDGTDVYLPQWVRDAV